MKIYFDGCSFTEGGGKLREKYNIEEVRYSRKVANHFNAEEYNFSRCGNSNISMLRVINENIDLVSQCDVVVIQMTLPSRTEYYNKGWKNAIPRLAIKENDSFWLKYYQEVYQDEFGETYEYMVYNSIKMICKALNKPLIILSIHNHTKLLFDFIIETPIDTDSYFSSPVVRVPLDGVQYKSPEYHKKGHPTKMGHFMIAKHLIPIIESKI